MCDCEYVYKDLIVCVLFSCVAYMFQDYDHQDTI